MINKLFTCLLCVFLSFAAHAQTDNDYARDIQKALALYFEKNYLPSATAYSQAFTNNGGHAYTDDRYNAACSWAMAGYKDSSFAQLMHIATKANFQNLDRLLVDDDLENLNSDPRWQQLLALVKQNKEKTEGMANKKQKSKSTTPTKKNSAQKAPAKNKFALSVL